MVPRNTIHGGTRLVESLKKAIEVKKAWVIAIKTMKIGEQRKC